jgi:ATP-dependent DNA helicase RecG
VSTRPPSRGGANAPRRYLDDSVQHLAGVGPARADAFRRLGVFTARDLFFHVPHRYEDASTVSPIARLRIGDDATVIGTVVSKGVLPTRKGLRVFQAVLQDASGLIEASWPGQPFLDRAIKKDDVLLVTGPVRFFHGRQLVPREFVNLGAEETGTAGGRVLSVYPATEGLSFKIIRQLIDRHLDEFLPLFDEYIPAELLAAAGVPPIREALRAVHRPTSLADARRGRSRLAYEELLFYKCGPSCSRARRARVCGLRTNAISRASSKRRCRSNSPAHKCVRRARSLSICVANVGCIGCSRATLAAARRSSRSLRRCSRWRTVIRPP